MHTSRTIRGVPTGFSDLFHHFPDVLHTYLPYQRRSLPQLAVQFALRADFEIHSFDATISTTFLADILDRIGLFYFCSFFTNGPAILAGLIASQT